MNTLRRQPTRFALLAGAVVLVWTCIALRSQNNVIAQANVGIVGGTVTVDAGDVRAFRVKARDDARGVTYSIYTTKGQYRFNRLPPGSYSIQIFEPGYEGPAQKVDLAAGEVKTANFALTSVKVEQPEMTTMEFEQLYPPGPTRDLIVSRCLGCHGPAAFHRRGAKTRAGWAAAVERMFVPANIGGVGSPMIAPGTMTDAEKNQIIDYLTANFGPGSPRRDLKQDPLVRDEAALANALFIQYDLMTPEMTAAAAPAGRGNAPAAGAPPAAPPAAPPLRRGTHDVFPSVELPGTVWIASIGSDEILTVDISRPDLTVAQRTKTFPIPLMPGKTRVGPHSVVERGGKVYFTEIRQDYVGEIDIRQNTIVGQYAALTQGGGMHTLRIDRLGNVWYSQIGSGKIGRLDGKTKQVKEWDPVPGANYYGVQFDDKDRVWVNGISQSALSVYDPKTDKWTVYKAPNNMRRISIDARGNIWLCEYFGNSLTTLDPNTGKFTRYPLPLKYGNPYEALVDKAFNVWTDVAEYNSLAKLDGQTKKYTYFPFPDPNGHTPKIEVAADGTLYYGYLGRPFLFAFKENGNRPASGTARN